MIDTYKNRFLEYAGRYDPSDGRVRLKIVHTLAVTEVMRELCRRRSITGRAEFLALLCALFHDIGRFEQLRRFQTFLDSRSVDHAALGCQILEEEGLIEDLPRGEQEMILTAIRSHNQYAIEPGLSPFCLTLCRLVRDADKCDIFRVFATEPLTDVTGFSAEETAASEISEKVAQAILAHRPVRREDRKNGLDFCLSFLGFFFDFNYPESIAIAREQGYYRLPFAAIPFRDPDTRAQAERLLAEVEAFSLPAPSGDANGGSRP